MMTGLSQYNTKELEHEHEEKIGRGMITKFPEWTSPILEHGTE